MDKKIKKLRIFDPVSAKYKIVTETPEIKRQIQERQKKQKEERKAKQKANKIVIDQFIILLSTNLSIICSN